MVLITMITVKDTYPTGSNHVSRQLMLSWHRIIYLILNFIIGGLQGATNLDTQKSVQYNLKIFSNRTGHTKFTFSKCVVNLLVFTLSFFLLFSALSQFDKFSNMPVTQGCLCLDVGNDPSRSDSDL